MKHLQAGLILGAIIASALVAGAILWKVFEVLMGTTVANSVLIGVAIVIIGSSVLDWFTEKR